MGKKIDGFPEAILSGATLNNRKVLKIKKKKKLFSLVSAVVKLNVPLLQRCQNLFWNRHFWRDESEVNTNPTQQTLVYDRFTLTLC